MDECYERSKFKKHIREQLQEIGFKPSRVSKLMGLESFMQSILAALSILILTWKALKMSTMKNVSAS